MSGKMGIGESLGDNFATHNGLRNGEKIFSVRHSV